MTNIPDEIAMRKMRNRAAINRAKKRANQNTISFKEPKRVIPEGSQRIILTFYHQITRDMRRLKYGNDATSYRAMMDSIDRIPACQQMKYAGIDFAIFPQKKSSLIVEVTEEQRMLLLLCLPSDIKMMNEVDWTPPPSPFRE